MLRLQRAGNQNDIQINEDKRQALSDLVHEPLDRLSGVLQAERHTKSFEQAERGNGGGLGNVIRADQVHI